MEKPNLNIFAKISFPKLKVIKLWVRKKKVFFFCCENGLCALKCVLFPSWSAGLVSLPTGIASLEFLDNYNCVTVKQ